MEQPIAERLKAWRKRKGFSQEAAAEYLKVSPRTYAGWEQGKSEPVGIGKAALECAIEDAPNIFTGRKTLC